MGRSDYIKARIKLGNEVKAAQFDNSLNKIIEEVGLIDSYEINALADLVGFGTPLSSILTDEEKKEISKLFITYQGKEINRDMLAGELRSIIKNAIR